MSTQTRFARSATPLAVLAVLAAACASTPKTGIISARWTAPDRGTTPVTVSWDAEDRKHGHIYTTLGPNGEHYHGTYVRITAETHVSTIAPVVGGWSGVWTRYDWGLASDPWAWGPGLGPVYGAAYYNGFIEAYTGKVVATLFGSHGHSMRCRFDVADPELGLTGGGIGTCQTSDGATLDAEF